MATFWLSPDVCKAWEKTGKDTVLKQYEELSSTSVSKGGLAAKTADRLLYELVQSCVKGTLRSSQVLSAVRELLKKEKSVAISMVSISCIVDAETKLDQDSLQRKNFLSLLKDLKGVIPVASLKEQLDSDTLEQVGLVRADDFNKKYIKIKTKLYYKQQKFNLLREESEGYAKLITEISQEPNARTTAQDKLQNIKSLIGCFNLDPNRVLDIVLQVFESRTDLGEELYVPILTQYMPEYDSICQILGFHLTKRRKSDAQANNVFDVIALLMKHGIITLDAIYPHLLPSDADIKETYKKNLSDARMSVKRTTAVHTGDKKDGEGDRDTKSDDKKSNDKPEKAVVNDKLCLTESLLKQGAWYQAKELMDRLPQYHATSHPAVAKTMCQLVHYVIDPMYQKYHGLPAAMFGAKPFSSPYGSTSITQAHSFSELAELAVPMLRYLGCHLLCDSSLTTKIIRIIKSFISLRVSGDYTQTDSDMLYRHFLAIVDEVLLPSLCLADSNCCLAEQIWSVLQLLPYQLRYQLYGQWKSQSYYTQPELIAARLGTLKRAKYIFSRLTKDNVKQQGRLIGKLSHANPAVFFEYMFTQVQVYDNLISPIVDALKYLSSLSFDVLTYCLIEALAAPDKEKMKYDDTNLSPWLKSLANFAALALKKYQVEFAGLLQYICNQLKAEKSFDLLILREMLTKMGGIEVSEEITDQHLQAMCGGDLLRQEGGNFLQTRNVKRPSQRLKETVLKHNLATPLAALMAQQRDCIIYKESVSMEHIKLVGKVYDQCQDTFVQFIAFLSSVLSIEEFSNKLPTLEVMLSEYHIPSDAAFYLIRPMLTYNISHTYESLRKQDKQSREKDRNAAVPDKGQRFIEAFNSVISPVIEKIKPLYDSKMWDDLSPSLFTMFWTLSAYDLHIPRQAYDREVNQVKQKMQQLDQDAGRDMREAKKKKEIERCNQMITKFKTEEKGQADHVARVFSKLEHDKDQWFKAADTQKQVERFIQFCIFPRVLNTTVDAFYCAKMIHTMHKIKTPHFGTLIILDRIFNDITYLITCCTENEAHRYGRFLCSVLEIVMRWRSSDDIYKKECSGHPGFITTFRAGSAGTNYAELSFEDFRHVCHKWQFRMTRASIACFESGNYTQIRNALIVLTKVLPHFPKIIGVGQALERRVDRVYKEEKEKRPDLYALAMGYSGLLKGRKSHWLAEQDFHYVNPEKLKKKQEELRAKAAAKAEASKSESVTIVKVAKSSSDGKAESGSSNKTSSSSKSNSASGAPAASSKSAAASSGSSSKSLSKDRAEAAAFLKEQSKSKKVDSVELPPKMKSEGKTEVKQEAKSVTNGSSSAKASGEKVRASVKTEKRELKPVKSEKKDRKEDLSKSASSSPSGTERTDSKRRKVDPIAAAAADSSNVRSRSSEKRQQQSGNSDSPIIVKSPSNTEVKSEKRERGEATKEPRKRTSDHPSERPEASKKRRSDVLAGGEGAPKPSPKTERHKNGGTDAEIRPPKRAKDEVREKERKSDKHRSARKAE